MSHIKFSHMHTVDCEFVSRMYVFVSDMES